MVSLPSLPRPSALPSRPTLPRVPRPSRSDLAAALRSLPRLSLSSLTRAASRPGTRLRPSAETVDATLALAALGAGVGVVATAVYTAARAVLPLALLRGLLTP
ncbi:hypothetical protein [Halarchaeum nitratireducens]|uniref:Uncharacterized protein n=1 Tax=Halarchaeum nitratireducens TaxID=489913 RepID=A0A830G7R0_9EURY|nr:MULTISPECIES: hypothetical protein [Halarchaeum]MBP2251399.1 hypothetical protein [Halarchaeum solikamskense]GGN07556.1 hypothetical protein GCM10009021_03420 [Halarchaeum nitratireducens]